MILLQLNGISKSYGAEPVLSNISLHIEDRERIGLVGVNGAGKSTLLKMIAGELLPDQGSLYTAKEADIGYLAQNSGLHSDDTIWQELLSVYSPLIAMEQELRQMETLMADAQTIADAGRYERLLERYAALSEQFRERGGYEMEGRIRGVLHGMGLAGFSADTPVSALSGGQKTRLALAKMLLQAPELLLLDEPTNYLDIEALSWLEDYLRVYSGAVLVVSHDRYFLDAVAGSIVELERTSARRFAGNYSRYVEQKAAIYEQEMKQYEKQQDEIAKMKEFVQRNLVRASTTKRAQSRRKALERMDMLDKPQGELKKAFFAFEVERPSGKEVLKAEGLSVSFSAKGTLFHNVTFDLRRGEAVALIGANGMGKSTLLKALIGELPQDEGTIQWGAGVRIGYYEQTQAGLNPGQTMLDEVWNAFPHLEEMRIRTVLGHFLFSGEDVFKKISVLSGGEKARVALAKLMLSKANVLVLDEPTNHLDLYSKEVLEAALLDYEGTILFVSHDRYFLNKMAERVLELTPAGIVEYLGNYDDYAEKKTKLAEYAEGQEAQAAKSGGANGGGRSESARNGADGGAILRKDDGSKSAEAEKRIKRQERTRQRKMEQLEREIAALEAEIAALEEQLTLPEVYSDYALLQEKTAWIEQKKQALSACYGEWEELIS